MPEPEFYSAGQRDRFEIAIRSRRQRDAADRWPAGYGWSLGDLRVTVGGRVLTEHVRPDGQRRDYVTWYLLPVFEWLAEHWVELLHEEEFGWQERSTAGAATVIPHVLAESTGRDDPAALDRYERAQAWAARHGWRAAAEGGLLPDLYIRRFLDSIELSWTDTPPLFAPDGFRFVSRAGYAACTIDEVAGPLWEVMNFFADGGIGRARPADQSRFGTLTARMAAIRGLTVLDFAQARIAPPVLAAVTATLGNRCDTLLYSERVANDVPAIAAFSPAVAMYGGLAANIGTDDVVILSRIALDAQHRGETPALARLVRDAGGVPRRAPPLEGQELAENLLEDLELDSGNGPVDLVSLLDRLGIAVIEEALATDSIRGVALAGQGMGPTIIINTTSFFNDTVEGRRFTLAHELCHILYDRGQGRRVGISSGPWAPASVEKRANAFAAMLLMPRDRVIDAFNEDYSYPDAVIRAAEYLAVTRRALTEHLFNIYLISESDRERLRDYFLKTMTQAN